MSYCKGNEVSDSEMQAAYGEGAVFSFEPTQIPEAPPPPVEHPPERRMAADFYNRAIQTINDQHMKYKLLVAAVDLDPDFGLAWYALGNEQFELGLRDAAVASCRRALATKRRGLAGDLNDEFEEKTRVNLGHRLYHNGELDEAEKETLALLEKYPGAAFGYVNLALLHTLKGEHDEAIRLAEKAFSMEKAPIVQMALAFSYLFARRWGEGLIHFEARFKSDILTYANFPYPRWEGDETEILYIVSDQGLGDTMQFCRYVPLAARNAKKIVMSVHPEMVRLMKAMLPDVEIIPNGIALPAASAWCPVVSLPIVLGLTDEQIEDTPPVPVPPMQGPAGWKRPGTGLHVGLVWAGHSGLKSDRWRSMPVTEMFPLAAVEGVHLYSLQVGDRAPELHSAGGAGIIRDLSPFIRDTADTAQIIRELDLVISVDSFPAHLAGTLGVETWMLSAYNGSDWRWGRGDDEQPWYTNVRVIRQNREALWSDAIGLACIWLKGRVKCRHK